MQLGTRLATLLQLAPQPAQIWPEINREGGGLGRTLPRPFRQGPEVSWATSSPPHLRIHPVTEQECGTQIGLGPEVEAEDVVKDRILPRRVGRVGAIVSGGAV